MPGRARRLASPAQFDLVASLADDQRPDLGELFSEQADDVVQSDNADEDALVVDDRTASAAAHV